MRKVNHYITMGNLSIFLCRQCAKTRRTSKPIGIVDFDVNETCVDCAEEYCVNFRRKGWPNSGIVETETVCANGFHDALIAAHRQYYKRTGFVCTLTWHSIKNVTQGRTVYLADFRKHGNELTLDEFSKLGGKDATH